MLTCSRLREVVLQTPQCWSAIHISRTSIIESLEQAWFQSAQHNVNLSRATDIDLRISDRELETPSIFLHSLD